MSSNKAQFLDSIRQALGRTQPTSTAPVPTPVDESIARLARPEDDLPALFAERAAKLGMEVKHTTHDRLAKALVDELEQSGVRSVVSALDNPAMAGALCNAGIEALDWRVDRSMAACYAADAGLTGAAAALAETGSLVLQSTPAVGRGLPLAPPLHVVVVEAGQILADMLDLWSQPVQPPPAWQGLISGPSKTSDIEGVLIQGVHGPERVVILLVDDA